MGLFKKELSGFEKQHILTELKQLDECATLINTTVKPDVFFGRLNFLLDLLLDLQKYEKYKYFKKNSTPTKEYNKILNNLDATVNNFIDRALTKHEAKIASLKTDTAKRTNAEKFSIEMIAAFDNANSFWQGNGVIPHYTGPLFTEANYLRVKALYEETI